MIARSSLLSAVLLMLVVLASCTTAPYTGRSQLMFVSESQEASMGEEAYRHELRNSVLLRDYEAERIVRKVGERIARAANKPDYRWEFHVIDDPEMVNAFAVPGGKVAVYSGIFPVAQDETGLAVVLGHEVAHALLRHAGERISQSQLLGAGMMIAGASGINPQLLQVFGMGASVGLVLPFSRSQESEADHVGLILMAKAGYDPGASLEVWQRMEKRESGRDRATPPEFLSTHPGYETRVQRLREYIPEALTHYRPAEKTVESLPSLQSLDSPKARAERELLKRIQAVNRQAGDARGERAVVEALGYALSMDPNIVYQERQKLRVGYGQYGALRALSSLGRASLSRIVGDYQSGVSWSELSETRGARLIDLISWMGDLRRTATAFHGQLRTQPPTPRYRTR